MRRRLWIVLSCGALLLTVSPASANTIYDYHTGSVTNIGGTPCDLTWEHVGYTNGNAYAETLEVSSCDNVQAILYVYKEGQGWRTYYGPQQNLSSVLNLTSILDLAWQKACGNAACNQYA
jgi:hypothetical protein